MTAVLLAASLASAQASEQLAGFDLERLETNVGRGTLLVGNGTLLKPGGLSINLMGHYQRMPLVLNDGEQDLRVVQDRATGLLAASYGVLSWLELSAQVPFVLWQQGDDPSQVGLAPLAAQGVGTPLLQARLGLLTQDYQQPVDLSVDLGVGLPLGTGLALAGDAGPRFHARMVVGTTLGWLQPSLEAGVLFRPAVLLASPDQEADSGATSEIRLGAGLATTGQKLRGELGLRTTLVPQGSVAPQVSMELLGGVRFPLMSGLDAFILGGPGVGGAPGTPRFRVLAGISFGREPPPPLTIIEPDLHPDTRLTLNKPTPPPVDNPVIPVKLSEYHVSRDDSQETSSESSSRRPPRPYQPGPRELVVLRGEIHFAQGSTELPGVVPLLDQVVLRYLEQTRGCTIIVEGHADTEGTETSNMIISQQRAQAVRRYLTDQNIPGKRVRAHGHGSHWPVSTQPATAPERQLNRRVEVFVVTEQPAAPILTKQPAAPITTQAPVP